MNFLYKNTLSSNIFSGVGKPHDLLYLIENKKLIPVSELKNKTIFEYLFTEKESKLAELGILKYKESLQKAILGLQSNFSQSVTNQLHDGLSLPEAHLNSLFRLLEIDKKSDSFDVDFKSIESNLKNIDKNIFSVEQALKLFPVDMHQNISLCLDKIPASKAVPENNYIFIRKKDDLIYQMGEAAHELGHILELNKDLVDTSLTFLRKRSNLKKVSMKDFCEENNKSFKPSWSKTEIFSNNLVTPYAGKIYGTLDDCKGTEIISIGFQMMVVDPVLFFFRDPEYFVFIKNIIKEGQTL